MSELSDFLTWASDVGFGEINDEAPNAVWVRRVQGSPLTRVSIDADLFSRSLPAYESSALVYWPEASRRLAAFRLLTIHIEEALQTAGPNPRFIEFDGAGFSPKY